MASSSCGASGPGLTGSAVSRRRSARSPCQGKAAVGRGGRVVWNLDSDVRVSRDGSGTEPRPRTGVGEPCRVMSIDRAGPASRRRRQRRPRSRSGGRGPACRAGPGAAPRGAGRRPPARSPAAAPRRPAPRACVERTPRITRLTSGSWCGGMLELAQAQAQQEHRVERLAPHRPADADLEPARARRPRPPWRSGGARTGRPRCTGRRRSRWSGRRPGCTGSGRWSRSRRNPPPLPVGRPSRRRRGPRP